MILPASSKTQSHDQLSPISTPIVSFCSLKISLPNTCTVLIFFIAGLLLCLEHVFHWERIASRWRPAFSSHLVSRALPDICLADLGGRLQFAGLRAYPQQRPRLMRGSAFDRSHSAAVRCKVHPCSG